jgi:hypothetical protein
MNIRTSTSLALLMAFGTACAPDDDPGAVELRPYEYTCPTWRCGFNSAEVNGRSIAELNLDGVANSAGIRITGYTPPLLKFGYTLGVEGDELVARKGASVLRRDQLLGSMFWIEGDLLGLPLSLPITIADWEYVPSWAAGKPPIVAYTLLYLHPLELVDRNVCSGSLLDPLASVATVLGGERYDDATKTVVPDPRWFTIACAGSAAAKLKLLGYGPQSSATTVARRQTTLKMITADYCGEGVSYTANGTPIQWANADGTVAPDSGEALGDVEAVWNEHGALCLGEHRLAGTVVACDQPLPSCAGLDVGDGEWITYVP